MTVIDIIIHQLFNGPYCHVWECLYSSVVEFLITGNLTRERDTFNSCKEQETIAVMTHAHAVRHVTQS